MKSALPSKNQALNIALTDFRYVFSLLEKSVKGRFILLSILQTLLAFLEVIALGALALTINVSMNSYTNISREEETNWGFLREILRDLSTEEKIGALLGTYVLLTIVKTFLSAVVTLSALRLLANQSALLGFKINRDLFTRGIRLVRFGKSQENLSGVTGSLDSLLVGYLGSFSQLSGDFATILMVGIALLIINVETSLLLLVLFFLLLSGLHLFVNLGAARLGENLAISATQLNRRILDSFLVYREALLAGRVNELLGSTLPNRLEIAENRARLSFLPSLSKYIFEIFLIASALVISAIQLWISGISAAISSFAIVVAASARLLPALLRLQGSLLSMKQSLGGGVYALSLLEELGQVRSKQRFVTTNHVPDEEFSPRITVDSLSYTYPDSDKPAVNGLSLSVTPGSFIAVTGSSGSGKSTLVDLLLGFLQPSFGSVLISGLDPIFAHRVWPGKIAYVPQDVQIFEGTIAQNVTLFSDKECDKVDVLKSIDLSGLVEDLRNLPEGIETRIGERGLKLSGGQKQRLGIARALYTNPSLIIFDEATSSLDPITENRITKNIYQKSTGRTVLVIAHRLSTVMNADKVIYLKDGNLIASGTFVELKESVPEFLKQAELSGL